MLHNQLLGAIRDDMASASSLLEKNLFSGSYNKYIAIIEQNVALLKQCGNEIGATKHQVIISSDVVDGLVRYTEDCLINVKVIYRLMENKSSEMEMNGKDKTPTHGMNSTHLLVAVLCPIQ